MAQAKLTLATLVAVLALACCERTEHAQRARPVETAPTTEQTTTTTMLGPIAVSPPKRQWATPMEKPGLPNLHRVTADLYRGAQPTAEGMRQLKAMGIKTVVDLRSFHSDRDEIGDTGLAYERIAMKAWHSEDEDVIRFLQIVTDESRTPVFVHCQHGADRTGLTCAVYRVAVCGWSKAEAIQEMKQGGFGFHEVWKNIPEYLEKLDMDDIKRQAGMGEETNSE